MYLLVEDESEVDLERYFRF